MSSHFESEARPTQPPSARRVLRLPGPPRVMVEGSVTMGLRAQKALALLAYLAVEVDRPHPRRTLAALFWPDQPETQAPQDLRQTLSRLRTVHQSRG